MKITLRLLAVLLCASVASIVVAQEKIPDVFADPAIDFSRPADRARAMTRIAIIENARLQNARAKAMAMGLPLRMEKPGGGTKELIDFDGEQPVYLETKNANAAISTAANLVRTSPYMLDGSGLTVGVWDAAGGRPTHQEFVTGSRLTNMNGTTTNYHSMHVAGTIAALGVDSLARGMANAARINSYDWNSDISEMGTAGATAPGQTSTKVYLSNHSYGTADGWDGNTWVGTGTDQNAYDIDFGRYSSSAQSMDSTAYNTPYLLSFWAAGNERSDNPATGATVVIGGITTTYNPTIHPPGDGKYRNGYETISYRNLAKNVVTVGAVNDAVTSGVRDLAKATISSFSSTGPTDDGRIKPDLVANGVGLRSTYDTSDTAYNSISGTSMATPNACGSAALLVDQYNRLFGSAMRASTLKALLIHTADDLGNPGPDYFFGWGLIDVKDAADLLIDHQASPTKKRLTEDQVSTSITSRTHSFTWDGVSPIKATIAWTDPAGTAVSAHDSRTPTLKNNLNLKLIAPNGTEYFPFVMPFVGTWTVASMSQNATTGINNTDNVEQVLVNAPGQAGDWRAVVSYTGTLTNNLQNYGLIISGSANQNLPLVINSISPASGVTGTTVTADITGTKLGANTAIRLKQAGRADIIGTSVQMINSTTLRCQFNLTGAASGLWSIVATNPDTETFTLPDAFTITGSLSTIWSQNFDGTVTGWSSQSTIGTNSWTVSTAQSHSPAKSYFAPGPGSTTTTWLVSPQIGIPSNLTNLQIEFWHNYNLQSGFDGGRFALSLDNGATWFDVTSASSGAAFTSNGYNTTMASNGQVGEFAGLQAWSGTSNGFIRTIVTLNDIPKYAGQNLRMRWGIATNSKTSSTGWYVDSIALLSDSSAPNQPPVITTAATTNTSEFQTDGSTTWHVLRGTGTNLSVTASDDAGEPDLLYTWQSSGPAPVTFSLNGNNAAKNTTATFSAAGDYAITVTVLDTGGFTTASTVNVRVLETSTFVVAPDASILNVGQTQQFTATLINQFGTLLSPQPSPVTWSTTGGGAISSGGLFTATSVGGPYYITATAGAYADTAEVTVNRTQAGIELQNLSRIYNGSQQVVTAVTSPPGLAYSVTYDGQSTAPTNGGSYDVVATITDPNYEGTTNGTLVIAYTVSYQGNGNTSGTVPADQTKFHDVNLTLATNSGNLNKADYSFVGWNTAADGSGTDYPAGAIYSGNASLILYAKWVPGADGTWIQTTAGPFDWGTTDNWSGGTVASGADQTAFFTPNITANQVVNLDSARTIGNITFTDSTTSSNDLTISGANILNLVRTSGTPTINVTNRTLTISSQIAGNNGLQKTGAGTLTLSGTNTFSGGTTLNAGTLATTADGNFGTSGGLTVTGTATWNAGAGSAVTYNRALAINSGTLSLTSGNALKTITGVLSGSGSINNTSTTTFDFTNTGNTLTGTVNNGYETKFASLGDSSNAINLIGSNSRFTWTGDAKTFALRPFTLNATGTGNIDNTGTGALSIQQNIAISGTAGARTLSLGGTNTGINTFSGNIADGVGSAVSLTKAGAGTWALGGTNTYTGNTNLSAALGRLVFQGSQSLSPNTKLIFAQASSNVANVRFLDDGAGTINFNRPIEFGGSNTSQVLGIFVGNNNTANQGSGSGTTSGSTIQVGNITHTSTAADTSTWSINITGANGYRLQTGILTLNNLVTRTANNTTTTILNPTTANMTVAAITMASGNTGTANDGIPVLRLDGTSSDNRVTGAISNAPDYLTGQALSLQKQNTSTWTLTGANSYTGTTTITGGILQLGDGSSGNDGTIENTSGITNNATLVFNRFGALSSSVPITGTGAVTKNGAGSQTLTGANSYTGATSVNAGKLFINGNQASATGAVSVSADATLGGTGIIGGNTTIAANGKMEFDLSTDSASHDKLELSAGKTLTFSGASVLTITSSGGASNGNYTLVSAPGGISGNAPSTLVLPNGWTASVSKVGNDLILNVTLPDITAPTLTSIIDDQSGGLIPANTLVTYTVTFSEDMDASSVTAGDFGNAGSSAVTIGSVSETSAGVFTVEATPTTAGTLQLQINQSAILKDVAGNNLDTTSAIADDTTITVDVVDPYTAWSGGAPFDVDANADGVENGMAWVLGATDPSANAASLLPTIDNTSDANYFIFTYRRSDAAVAAGATIAAQYSNTLTGWTTAAAGPDIVITPADNFYGAGIDKVEVKLKRTLVVDGKLFTRLTVTP